MGKGSFIKSKASDKEVNFIGIEKYPSVQVIAVKDIENEIESKKDYSNLRFISMDAEVINE
jgi:tRNA G46 methylase TrmB